MTPAERKIALVVSYVCFAVFCAAVISIGFHIHRIAGLTVIALIAMRLSYTAARTLKDNPEK